MSCRLGRASFADRLRAFDETCARPGLTQLSQLGLSNGDFGPGEGPECEWEQGGRIRLQVLPGNTADCTTLRDMLRRIEAQYGKAQRIWVMGSRHSDRGRE